MEIKSVELPPEVVAFYGYMENILAEWAEWSSQMWDAVTFGVSFPDYPEGYFPRPYWE